MSADRAPAAPAGTPAGDERPLLVGVDVGGSKIAVLVVDQDDRVLTRESAPASARPQSEAANVIARTVDRALAAAGASRHDVAAIGVGVPGRVDPQTGSVSLAVNLDWEGIPLGRELETILGRPCVIENDVRAAAIGLHRRRIVGDVDDLAYLSVGTGVSAGVILEGRLHRGARGLAGEIGHVLVEPGGARCNCGAEGCLETVVSGPHIARQAREAIAEGGPTILEQTPAPSAIDVYRAVEAGDPLATEIADRVGRRVAWAVHLLVMTYDVERVVLGGGVSHAGEAFARPIQLELDRLRATSALAREQLVQGFVDVLPPTADAGAWGAVTIAAAHAGTRRGQGWREVGHVRDP